MYVQLSTHSSNSIYIDHIFGIPYDYYSAPWEKEANIKAGAHFKSDKPPYPDALNDYYRIYRIFLERFFK